MPSTEHPQKPCATQHAQNAFFFFQKCGEEAEGRYYNHFSSSHSEANTHAQSPFWEEMLAWGEVL